jgi:5-methylcytosine-specific restriction endonuclease McrBC GTP-binding regulatory subunit McrB
VSIPKLWQISPGHVRENLWQEFYQEGIIAIGWEMGNLLDYSNKQELERKEQLGPNDLNSCWSFSHEIGENDIIVAKKGSSREVYGIGRVVLKKGKTYDYKKERKYYRHVIPVKWHINFPTMLDVSRLPTGFVQWTVQPLSEESFNIIMDTALKKYPHFRSQFMDMMKPKEKIDEQTYTQMLKLLESKKQIILYGPPGTGKTWLAKKFVEEFFERNPPHKKTATVTEDIIIPEPEDETRSKLVQYVTFHQSYSYEEFVEGIRPELKPEGEPKYCLYPGIFKNICDAALKDKENTYFLVIDEINRGNISKIFGELITLLEKDKRLGPGNMEQENTMRAQLPYLKERPAFVVPWNLYVIGTMNTADKSIALVDVALRRRFGFFEVIPDPSKVKLIEVYGITVRLPEILRFLNMKISILIDKDHQIGHSYLMNIDKDASGNTTNNPETLVENLKFAFYNEIFPLIQEYFYNDWEKIQRFLGPNFIEVTKNMDQAQEIIEDANQGIYEIKHLNGKEFVVALNGLTEVPKSSA